MSQKQKITSDQLGLAIANDVLSDMGRSATPFGQADPFFLPPEDMKRFVIESKVAHIMFFTHFFMRSCPDVEFARRAYQRFGGQITLRMSENPQFQAVVGLGKHQSSKATYDELSDAFYDRGNFYLNVLKNCPEGDYTAFAKALNAALHPSASIETNTEHWDRLADLYQKVVVRIWNTWIPEG